MARVMTDTGEDVYGIACEEYTAVCVDEEGIGHVYGNYPADDDYAYFLQPDCIEPNQPEFVEPDTPLTWNRGMILSKCIKSRVRKPGNSHLISMTGSRVQVVSGKIGT